jgi:hypothetical protein
MQVLNNYFGTSGFTVTSRLSGTQFNGFNPLGGLFFYTADAGAVSDTKLVDLGDQTGWPSRHSGSAISISPAFWYLSFDSVGGTNVAGSITSLVRQPAAAELTYSFAVTASGSLNGVEFNDKLVTMTLIADPSTVIGSGGFFTVSGTTTISVAGVGTATIIDDMKAFVNTVQFNGTVPFAGMDDATQGPLAVVEISSPAFASWDLRTPIGPISGPGSFNPGLTFPTSLGQFLLTAFSGNATFTATLGSGSFSASALSASTTLCFGGSIVTTCPVMTVDGSNTAPLMVTKTGTPNYSPLSPDYGTFANFQTDNRVA